MKRSAPLMLISVFLASCSQTALPEAPSLSKARVPIHQSQALVLRSEVDTGQVSAQSAGETRLDSVLVEDFDGVPFYYLTVIGETGNAADFWQAIASADTTYTIYGTGASIDRNLYAFGLSSDFGASLSQLKTRVHVKRLVSPQAQKIWLEDTSGQFWDAYTGNRISATELEQSRKTYALMRQDYLSKPEDIETMHSAWDAIAKDPTQKLAQDSVDRDGNLSAQKVISALPANTLQAQVSSQNDVASTGWLGWIQSRAGIAGSGLNGPQAMAMGDELRNFSLKNPVDNRDGVADNVRYKGSDILANPAALDGFKFRYLSDLTNSAQAAMQSPYFQLPPPGTDWGLRYMNPVIPGFRSGVDASIIGCVPTSFLRMLRINALYGKNASRIQGELVRKYVPLSWRDLIAGRTIDQQYIETNKLLAISAMLKWLTRPVQADSVPEGYVQPYASKIFGAGAMDAGTSVTSSGMKMGAETIAADVFNNSVVLVGGMRASFANLTLPTQGISTHPWLSSRALPT